MMADFSGISISQALFTNRRALEAASEARAKRAAREKRLYQTPEGLRDEDEFGDMLIAALTAQPEHVPANNMTTEDAPQDPVDAQAHIVSHAPGALVRNGYLANYYQQ